MTQPAMTFPRLDLHARAQRRRWLCALAAGWLTDIASEARAEDGEPQVRAWVVLTLPELASLPREAVAERAALQPRIQAQQEQVMAALRALGAVELGRVQQLRNALAVRLPRAQLAAARRVPGVRSVQPVSDVERGPQPPAT